MRVDTLGPRTWLLGAVAGWAVLLLLLALLGMGSRIARLADDPDLVRALPALRPAPPPRIGTLAQYGEAAARPLFADTRRPQPFSLQPEGEGEEAPQFEFVLTSVLQAPGLQMAIIQPAGGGDSIRMKLGEAPEEAQGWRLVELHPRSAVFEGPQGQKTLDLRTFDGTGGEAPTAVARQERNEPAAVEPAAVRDADAPVAAQARPAPAANAEPARPRPTSPTATTPTTEATAPPSSPEAQMEAIRRRIEARRAQLRAEARQKQQQQQDENP